MFTVMVYDILLTMPREVSWSHRVMVFTDSGRVADQIYLEVGILLPGTIQLTDNYLEGGFH